MTTYLIVSVVSGVLFGVMDGLINANPLGARLLRDSYGPILKSSMNPAAGIAIDLAYGFALAGLFWLLYPALPGGVGFMKGLAFGVVVWFLRVVMRAASDWMMLEVRGKAIAYSMAAGLGEMLVLGLLFGLTLKPGT